MLGVGVWMCGCITYERKHTKSKIEYESTRAPSGCMYIAKETYYIAKETYYKHTKSKIENESTRAPLQLGGIGHVQYKIKCTVKKKLQGRRWN